MRTDEKLRGLLPLLDEHIKGKVSEFQGSYVCEYIHGALEYQADYESVQEAYDEAKAKYLSIMYSLYLKDLRDEEKCNNSRTSR